MAIIYSYPSETNIQSTDLLVGTSTVTQNGVNENVTRSFSVGNLSAFIATIIDSVSSITFTAIPFLVDGVAGGTITKTGTVGMTKATDSTSGYLSSTDWNTFNNKFDGQTGTTNSIPVFNSPTTLADSALTDLATGIFSTKPFSPGNSIGGTVAADLGITGTNPWRNLFLSGTANAVNFTGTNLTLTGTLSANGSTGTGGFILQSQGAGAAQWVDLSTAYDRYDLNAGAKAGQSVPLNLTSTSGGDNSTVSLTQGTQIILTRNSANEITIDASDAFQGTVTSVASTNQDILQVAGGTGAAQLTPQMGTVATGQTGLVTGAQINTAINDALTGLVEFKGGYNATTNAPILDSRGVQIPAAVGDYYVVTVAGTFYTETVEIGDSLICQTATAAGAGTLASWVTVQSNIGVATATVQGIANFPTAGGLEIATGAVSAKGFASVAIAGNAGYVPDSTAAAANTFLAKDGTWTVGPASGVSNITFNTGLTGGLVNSAGATITVDYSTAANVILASGADATSIIDTDTFLFGTGNNVGYGLMSALKTYIGAGAGTVTTSGTPTANTIPVFSSSSAIGDSMIAQNAGGTTATITGALTTTGTLTMPSITDSASNTGNGGQVLTAGPIGGAGGTLVWDTAAASYTKWVLTGQTGTQDITDGNVVVITSDNTAITTAVAATNTLTITSTPYTGTTNIGHVPTGGSAGKYLDGAAGAWVTLPAGVPTITKQLFTATANQTNFTLTVNPTDINYVNVFVSGVYQNTNSVTVSQNGAVKDVVFSPGLSLGTIVECVSTT